MGGTSILACGYPAQPYFDQVCARIACGSNCGGRSKRCSPWALPVSSKPFVVESRETPDVKRAEAGAP
jgi:hypothetical protein